RAAAATVGVLSGPRDPGVVVRGGDGIEGPPRPRGVPETAGGAGAGERILRRGGRGRSKAVKGGQGKRHRAAEEGPPIQWQRAVVPSCHACPSPTSRTAYPA